MSDKINGPRQASKKEQGVRLPSDITAERFITVLRRMNRKHLKERGVEATELDKLANPVKRENGGGHTIVYSAETERTTALKRHAQSLTPVIIKGLLKQLGLDPAKFKEEI